MVGRRKVGPRSGPCSILPFEEQQGELDLREVLKEKKEIINKFIQKQKTFLQEVERLKESIEDYEKLSEMKKSTVKLVHINN